MLQKTDLEFKFIQNFVKVTQILKLSISSFISLLNPNHDPEPNPNPNLNFIDIISKFFMFNRSTQRNFRGGNVHGGMLGCRVNYAVSRCQSRDSGRGGAG